MVPTASHRGQDYKNSIAGQDVSGRIGSVKGEEASSLNDYLVPCLSSAARDSETQNDWLCCLPHRTTKEYQVRMRSRHHGLQFMYLLSEHSTTNASLASLQETVPSA
jgi:hypothetical protein